jgi:hypothetical protein
VKVSPLLAVLELVTITSPVVAPVGTVTAMLVALQLVTLAAVPLKLTVPDPWPDPKFVPVMVTKVPTTPDGGDRLVMLGVDITVKLTPLLFTPFEKTTTFPVVAPEGTVTLILVALQLVTLAADPLKLTVPDPWLGPKFVPVMVTKVPEFPETGDRLVIFGADTIVKFSPLLTLPETVTTTFPVAAPDGTVTPMLVALQLVTPAAVPLKLTVPLP